MRNQFTEEYGITHPIVQGALGVASMPPLVSAVSEAGGMGTLGAVGQPLMTSRELRDLIRAVRGLTDKPFGVNFVTAFATDEHVRECIDARIAVVSFDTAEPPPRFVRRLRRHGVRVWSKAGSVADARRAARAGVDAVIAHGREAGGGSRGDTGTFTLVPAVVDAIWPVPVLASGGIADARGVAAALALGADAAWIGTRFLASREANAHAEYKRRIVEAGEADTEITDVFSRDGASTPFRTLRNRVVRERRDGKGRHDRPGDDDCAGADPARRLIGRTELGGRPVEIPEFSCILPTPETRGDIDAMCLPAGQSVMLIRSILPAGELVRSLAKGRGV